MTFAYLDCSQNREVFGPSDLRQLADAPFDAQYLDMTIGSVSLCRFGTSPAENVILPRHRRGTSNTSNLVLNIVESGTCCNEQGDNNTVLQSDDFYLSDNHYRRSCRYPTHSTLLSVVVPRGRLERAIGPSRLYAGLAIRGGLPGASLVRNFFRQLVAVHDRLNPGVAERMTEIGFDLLTASLAERMAMDTPKPVHGTVVVQRAKAFIEANLGEAGLDPPHVAAAVGVSLRHLQQLFHAQDQHVSEWIWRRRLVRAARWLADPGHAHLPIGTVAHGCGFTSLPHFSRRFRASFDVTPNEYRRTSQQCSIRA